MSSLTHFISLVMYCKYGNFWSKNVIMDTPRTNVSSQGHLQVLCVIGPPFEKDFPVPLIEYGSIHEVKYLGIVYFNISFPFKYKPFVFSTMTSNHNQTI